MKHFSVLFLLLISAMILGSCNSKTKQKQEAIQKPNIVFIYVDDLGYADVSAYGAKGVSTPNVDNFVANGLKFTDAHCSAATCTPSRFSLLTGTYAFRNKAAILPGDAPLLIRPGTPTIASMLKSEGYATAVVGKWHLGLGDGNVDWNGSVSPGPNAIGFDYSFLIPATGDRVPCVYVEQDRVVGLDLDDPIQVSYTTPFKGEPTGITHPELVRMGADTQHSQAVVNGISRIGYMTGGEAALWTDEEFPFVMNEKSNDFIAQNNDKPFFLYYSFHDIHVPRLPHPKFIGQSEMGPRGDAIVQMDWCVGQIKSMLEKHGVLENTLIVFTSDNGPVLDDGYTDDAVEKLGDHNPSGPFRGGKYSAFESGTRVPTVAYWQGTIKPGVSDALMTQTDLYASVAALVGHHLSPNEAPDSMNMLHAWLGHSEQGREQMLEESFTLGLRSRNWKYIQPLSPTQEIPGWMVNKNIETGLMKQPQLYNLKSDLGEQINLADQYPEKVEAFSNALKAIVNRSSERSE